jgi:hypothetical protein
MGIFLQRSYTQSFRLSVVWALGWVTAALWLNFHTIANVDNGWLLYATQRYLNGEKPYVDFFETNPPLVLWLYMPPVYVAGELGLDVVHTFDAYVILLAAGSLALAFTEIRRHPLFGNPRYGNLVFAAFAMGLLCASAPVFGEREHFFILLCLPYFAQSLLAEREPPWGMRQCIIAVCAGIGFAIKPFFLLIWVAGEIYNAIALYRPLWLFRRTDIAVALTGLAYFAIMMWATPEYLSRIVPMLLLTYGAYNHGTKGMVASALTIGVIYLLPVVFAYPWKAPFWRVTGQMLVWLAAAFLETLVQAGWLYHYYPAMFFGAFLMVMVLALMLRQWQETGKEITPLRFAALWVTALLLYGMPLYIPAYNPAMGAAGNKAVNDYTGDLEKYISAYGATGKNMLVISFNLDAAFPAVNYLPVRFPFHFHHLWPLPGIIKKERESVAGLSEPLRQVKAFTLRTVGEDLKKFLPELVVVDSNTDISGVWGHFNFIAYLSQDGGFRAQWRQYRRVGTIAIKDKDGGGDETLSEYVIYARRH